MLARVARAGPWVLVSGLVVGASLPEVGRALFPYLPLMVLLLLFLSVLRLEPDQVRASLKALPFTVGVVAVFQLVVPLSILAFAALFGLSGALLTALVIMTAAPSIMGSPNMCTMMGRPPDAALSLLVVGTALLPLTVIPVFAFAPMLGGVGGVAIVALKLLGTIAFAAGAAFIVRVGFLRTISPDLKIKLEGFSAITLAVFVVALMPQLGDLLRTDPQKVVFWFCAVMIANVGLQLMAFAVFRVSPDRRVAVSVISGNRNIALFLVALPAEITAPILIWIGCYQIPMYLTPLMMSRLYRA